MAKIDRELKMNINDLPTLVFNHLFQYLNITERSIAKQVCQQWSFEVEEIDRSLDSLFIHPNKLNFSYGKKWSGTNELIGHKNSLQLPADQLFMCFQLEFNHEVFTKVKRLNISFPIRTENLTSAFVNKFTQLNQLELCCLMLSKTFHLDLDQLKVLTLKDITYSAILVNSPKDSDLVSIFSTISKYVLFIAPIHKTNTH